MDADTPPVRVLLIDEGGTPDGPPPLADGSEIRVDRCTANNLPDRLDMTPDVVVLRGDRAAVVALAHRLRQRGDALADAPILVDGADDDIPGTDGRASAALAAWAPPPNPAFERLAGVFGRDQIVSLATRFREQLIEAAEEVRIGDAAAIAHRIAGMAGTLGFAEVGAAWNGYRAGTSPATVLRETRRAIYRIALLTRTGNPT